MGKVGLALAVDHLTGLPGIRRTMPSDRASDVHPGGCRLGRLGPGDTALAQRMGSSAGKSDA